MEAYIRLDALAPSVGADAISSQGFVALHDRADDTWLRPSQIPTSFLESNDFKWNDRRWIAVRKSIADPAIDVVAVGQLDPFLVPFANTAKIGAIALTVAALIVVLLTMFVTKRLTRSLSDLAMAADSVSHGNLDSRIPVVTEDEVGRVARTFNEMISSIRRMMGELSQREAVAAMGELAAMLAHQLRSPATAMRLDLERAREKLADKSVEKELLGRSLRELERMERAIAGSLTFARSASPGFVDVDVREPLMRGVQSIEANGGTSRSCVKMCDLSSPLMVKGDAAALEQLFTNLLVNAAHAAGPSGEVVLFAEAPANGRTAIEIRDNGAGMSPAVLKRAGEPLFSTKAGGTGLGLAIANRIAAAHGGEIEITSVEGVGTTARVELPAIDLRRVLSR